jgi:predicted Fe-Mo cluster-binding NifX family protein
MRIAIPADKNDLNSKVSLSFGRAPFFAIYNTETDTVEFIDNMAATLQGGAGIKAAQIVADSKASVLLTPHCGQNAAEVLQSANIQIYKTADLTIVENVNAFKEGKLQVLKDIHPGYHEKFGR